MICSVQTVNTTHLSVDERRERQVVEEIREVFPHVGVAVLTQTLVIEAVDLRNLTTLVVAAQNGNAVFETNLNDKVK